MTSSSSDPNPSPSAAPLQSSPLSSPTSSVTSYLGHPENVVHGQHIRASLADPRRATDIFPKFMRRLMNTRLEVPNTSISTDYQAVGYVVFNDNDQQLSIDTALEASVKATRTHNALHILRTLRDNPGDNDRDVTSSKSPTRDSPLCIQNIRAETTTTLPIISSTRTFIESKSLGVDIVDISTTSIPQHGPDYILPTSYSRIANTFQLVDKERDWAALIDPFEKSHYYGLVDQLVRTFIEDPFKNPETIAEVVLVGTVLDKDTYCVLLSSFIAELTERNLRYLDILQGLVQLVECVSCEHLVDDDLVRIAIVLLNKLSVAHAGSNDHYLYLIWALSRILAVMAEVNVMKLNHSRDHQPTLQFLAGLNISSNIYVKYQAAYAYQALQYISNDDTSLQFAWRYIQGDAHVASAVTTLIRIDPSEFLKGVAGLTSAYEVPDVFAAAFEVGKAAGEDARTPFEAPLRIAGDASRSFKKRSWYLILQGTALYLRQGQFQDFKTIVSHAPCRNDPNFQWGICRQLGEIAADLLLDIHIRRQAVEFLFGLYRGHTSLKLHNDVKQWILIILSQVSDLSNSFLEEYGIPAIEYLKDIGISELPGLYPLNARLAQPKSFPLLVKVQNIPEVEYRLHALRSRRIKEYKDTQKLYIPPMAKPNLGAKDDTCFPLIDKVEEFLESNCQVMLILGDSGAGKSSFNRYLEYKLWQGYKSGSRIPLFINLPGIEKPDVDIIQKQLGIYNFTEFQIQELLQHRQLTLICDGYDESQLGCNLHTANRLNQSNQNDTKLIITCRSQYLGRDYYDRFVPNAAGQYNRGAYHLFQECVISSFSKTQVEGYVEQYVSLEPRIWTKTEYLKKLETIPNLMDLVRNPYLLTLCLEAFPTVIRDESESETDLSRVRVTRVLLYDRFVQHWLSAHKRRFHEVKMTNIKQQAFNALLDQGFEWNAFTYQMELAVAIFEKQDGHPVVDCFRKQDLNEWKVKFFGPDPEKELFRDSSLLIRAGTQPTIEGDMRDMQDHSSTDGHPLSKCNLVNKPSIIQFLAERTIQNANFKQQLLEIIDQSKNNQKAAQAAQAAANAITILVRAGVRFHGQNFQGIRIPGANLSGGLFDSAQFQEADLRGIKLIGSWIRQVDFSKTLMQGVEFGELPYLQFTSTVWSCAYSPDGRILAVGLSKDIILYDTADWRLISILEGHEDGVRGLAFSPSGDRLLSGSFDRTVRLWNYMTRTVDFILDGHTRGVISVAYSPCGKQVASVGRDGVVRLWDVRSGSAAIALSGHTDWIRGVVYSPDGMSFATASLDGTIRVYETRTSSVTFVVECGNEYISSVAFSPDDIRSVAFSPDGIRSIAYSPDGSKIVSGHSNGRIQLWDSVTGERLQSWQGHREYINRVIFSPSGQWIASCGDDKTVELWSTQTGKLVSSLSGHQWEVKDIYLEVLMRQYDFGI
ncbi:WD_REPEATS_REGION domain-containing protein [Linnemannia zychae]|nr:WD_REPEATS_REGION domain-containing protein [Linnemannia zychae]